MMSEMKKRLSVLLRPHSSSEGTSIRETSSTSSVKDVIPSNPLQHTPSAQDIASSSHSQHDLSLQPSPQHKLVKPIGPTILQEGQLPYIADLIFVHGLNGHPYKSWTFESGAVDICWPQDLLKDEEDLSNVRIIAWVYDSAPAKIFKHASQENIYGHAGSLLGDIARIRKGNNIPIIFIVHSLGGLVIKEALIKSEGYLRNKRHLEEGSIYSMTKGIIFMGTPHRGSDKASLADVVAKVAKVSLVKPNKKLLHALAPGSQILDNQRENFTTISSGLRTVCFREEIPTSLGMIVDSTSADIGGFNNRNSSINANHMNMAKFTSKTDSGYQRVLGHVKSLIKGAQEQGNFDESLSTENRKTVVLNTLDFPSRLERAEIVAENPPHEGTFSWATSKEHVPSFIKWLGCDDIPVFWITGKAGSGKTTLMHHLAIMDTIDRLNDWAGNMALYTASFFFFEQGTDPLQKSLEGLLRSILYQVLSEHKNLIPIVFEKHWADIPMIEDKIFNDMNFLKWTSLKAAFETLIRQKKFPLKLCIFIDGLDEYRDLWQKQDYSSGSRDISYDLEVSQNVSDNHMEIAEFLASCTSGSNTKIIVSSRPLNIFEHTFRKFPRLRLNELTANDIRTYVKDKLLEPCETTSNIESQEDMTLLVEEVVSKAEGVFLWVRIVAERLKQSKLNGDTLEELRGQLKELPVELTGPKGLYMKMLKSVKPEYRLQGSRIFQLVLNQCSSLDLLDLWYAEGSPFVDDKRPDRASRENLKALNDPLELFEDSHFDGKRTEMNKRLKSRCAGLLESPNFDAFVQSRRRYKTTKASKTTEVRFMHLTAKEFVQKDYIWKQLFSSAENYSFDPNLALLSACVRRVKCSRFSQMTGQYFASQRSPNIKEAMIYAKCVTNEDLNTVASFYLLDELNRSVAAIFDSEVHAYKNSGKGYDPSHWLYYRHEDLGDRTKSEDKFFSLAIRASLADYLAYKLRYGELDIYRKRSRPLLSYCTGDFSISPFTTGPKGKTTEFGSFPDPRVVEILLQYGADPEELWIHPSMNNKLLSIREKLLDNGLINFRSRTHSSSSNDQLFSQTKINTANANDRERWIKINKLMLQHSVRYKTSVIRKEKSKMMSVLNRILNENTECEKEIKELINIIDI